MIRVILAQPEPMFVKNAVIVTVISVEYSTNAEGNELLSDVVNYYPESPLSAIDNTRTEPSVMLQKLAVIFAEVTFCNV